MMSQPAQTVVYRLDGAHTPEWQFYSMPASIVGGGKTLSEAQSQYRDALGFALESDELPEVREYVESEAEGLGVWIRLPLTLSNSDAVAVTDNIARQIAAQPENRDRFRAHPTAGGEPVVIPAIADAPVSDIFDQMTPFDSLIVTTVVRRDEKLTNVWLAIAGSKAASESPDEPAPTSLEALGLTLQSPQRELFRVAVQHNVNRLTALIPC